MQAGSGLRFVAIALFWIAAAAFAQDATLERARKLLDAKQAKEAYALLAPLEQQRAGEVEFDFLVGVAAIDSGELTRGVFALERVLAVRPDHPRARAEIARAYFLMGENKTARQEFESVKRARPPTEVAATIDKFLDALEARERARGTGVAGFVEATAGYDTNASAGTSSSGFAFPLNPGFVGNAAKDADYFVTLAGGVSGRYPISDTLPLIGNAAVEQRGNASSSQFDTGSFTAAGGIAFTRDADEFTVAAQGQNFYVDTNRFRDAAGLVGQWRRTLSQNDQVSAYLQRTRLSYPGQSARDANRTVAGGAGAHSYAAVRAAASFLGVYAGQEETRGPNVLDYSHDLWGVRLGGQIGIGEKWTLLANASYENRRYGGPFAGFVQSPPGQELKLSASAGYAVDRNWTITPAIAYTDNRSNTPITDYERTMFSLSLRHDFR